MPRYVLLKDNVLYASNDYDRSIYQVSVEDFKVIKSVPTRSIPTKLTTDDNYLYFIGKYEYSNYYLDKIKL